jgi:uncharacterized membrane protein
MRRWSDERVEGIIGTLLRAGVIVAAAVVALGGALYLWRHGGEHPDYRAFHRAPPELRTFGPIVAAALAGSGRAIIQLGLVLLIATPVARVAFSVVAFALERDWLYVAITLTVLAILIFSLAGGI